MRISLSCCILGAVYASVMVYAKEDTKVTINGERIQKRSLDSENFIRLYIDPGSSDSDGSSWSSSSSSISSSSSSCETSESDGSKFYLEVHNDDRIQPNMNWIRGSEASPALGGAAYYQNELMKNEDNSPYHSMFAKHSNNNGMHKFSNVIPNLGRAKEMNGKHQNVVPNLGHAKEVNGKHQNVVPNLGHAKEINGKHQNVVPNLSMFQRASTGPDDLVIVRTHDHAMAERWSHSGWGNDLARIFEGQETEITKHPYQLQLGVNGSQYCSASVISRKWALSAAQCLFDATTKIRMPDSSLTLRAGADLKDDGGILYRVDKSIVNGQFANSGLSYEYDISLLKIFDSFAFSEKVRRISLPKRNYFVDDGKTVVVSGWGAISGGEEAANATKLRDAELTTVNRKMCSYSFPVPIVSSMICAGDEKKAVCQGDVGGPLVRGKLLVGIVSQISQECTSTTVPSVSTRVSKFRDWIKKNSGV